VAACEKVEKQQHVAHTMQFPKNGTSCAAAGVLNCHYRCAIGDSRETRTRGTQDARLNLTSKQSCGRGLLLKF